MKLSLEPWMPEYDTSLQEQPGLTSSRPGDVNLFVEGLEAWNPVQPLATRASEVDFQRLYFIDGRRRIEAKVYGETLVDNEPQSAPGLLGTFAVGLVESFMTNSPAKIIKAEISRVLVLNHPEGKNLIIKTRGHEYGNLEYQFVQMNETSNTDTALTTRLQFLMRNAEDELSSSLSLDDALLILDGPLQRRAPDRALGYVKTIHNFYVPPLEQRTIRQLQRGQRSPIFSIKSGLERYSWYLRLDDIPDYYQPFAGIVRLEVRNKLGLDWARKIADWTCIMLPKYAAKGFRDPRAPQQLMPIAFLESELGRRMGDLAIIRRRIQAYLRQERIRQEPLGFATDTKVEGDRDFN
jgi:uncharacterized protein